MYKYCNRKRNKNEQNVFLEGLPGVGKTTCINNLKNLKLKNVITRSEIINDNIKDVLKDTREEEFLLNDEMKFKKILDENKIIVVDRSPISTLVYNQMKHIMDYNYDNKFVEEWFGKFKGDFLSPDILIYYLFREDNYFIRFGDESNPFGTIENLKVVDSLFKYNIKKYCKNYKFINVEKENIMEIIYEDFNKFSST